MLTLMAQKFVFRVVILLLCLISFSSSALSAQGVEQSGSGSPQLRYRVDGEWHYLDVEDGTIPCSLSKSSQDIEIQMVASDGVTILSRHKLRVEPQYPIYLSWQALLVYAAMIAGFAIYVVRSLNNKKVSDAVQPASTIMLLTTDEKMEPAMASAGYDSYIMDRAQSVILNHLSDPDFNIDTFAAHMRMSKSTLYKKLKSMNGLTPNDLISSIRLRRAAELITHHNDEYSISQIAYKVGYIDPSYFSKCFKKEFGVTPRAYNANKYN